MSPALLRAELRAVAPLAAATVVLVLAGALGGPFERLGLVAWPVGTLAVCAVAVGHEFTDGTLGMLLAQPISRGRLLTAKVLAAALAVTFITLAGMWAGLPDVLGGISAGALFIVPASCVVGAPVVTMLTRSSLGGTAGTFVMPFALVFVVALTGIVGDDARFGSVLVVSTAVLGVACAVAVWPLFHRLEDRPSGSREVHLRFLFGGMGRQRGAISHLVRKELGLQQLPLVVSALYVGAAVVLAAFWPGNRVQFFNNVSPLYAGTVAMLIGAVACAEERQMGVLESQLLLPIGARSQFAIKVGVALAVCTVLTVLVPLVFQALVWAVSTDGLRGFRAPRAAAPVLWMLAMWGLTLAGIYTSSISSSGLRAFIATPVLMLAMYPFVAISVFGLPPMMFELLAPSPPISTVSVARGNYLRVADSIGSVLVPALGVAGGVLLMTFAASNHRQPHVVARAVLAQMMAMFCAAALGGVLIAALYAAALWSAF